MSSEPGEQLIDKLKAVAAIQTRIDLVADDYQSGRRMYAVIDGWTLGELLGIDFETAGDDGRTFWGYREARRQWR
jgi:hypothetical protein